MCLSVPVQWMQVDGLPSRCDARGIQRVAGEVLPIDAGFRPGGRPAAG